MEIDQSKVLVVIKKACLSADFDAIESGASFTDAGVDSLEVMTIFLAVEENFGIKIPDEDLDDVNTLPLLTKYLSDK
jgi:acyl carrier protein